MAVPELASNQRRILWALVNLFLRDGTPIKAREIADVIGRNPGTIRNEMTAMKALGLVETETGYEGGYLPADTVFDTLGIEQDEETVTVPIIHEDDQLESVTVRRIHFLNLTNPNSCIVRLSLVGPIHTIDSGDTIRLGPTPVTELVVSGTVEMIDLTDNQLIIRVQTTTTSFRDQSTPTETENDRSANTHATEEMQYRPFSVR